MIVTASASWGWVLARRSYRAGSVGEWSASAPPSPGPAAAGRRDRGRLLELVELRSSAPSRGLTWKQTIPRSGPTSCSSELSATYRATVSGHDFLKGTTNWSYTLLSSDR